LYTDGHQRIYYGYAANLPPKFIALKKLCLNSTSEYRINEATGMQVLMATGDLTEKLQHAIEQHIIPQLINSYSLNKNLR
jgi:hypothetical protein